jgi:16S rRNA (guanine966-N2)-methyltransferase
MRIIGGEAKGRRLGAPKGCRIRPTADRIKEALFNLLQPISGKSFLDLYAGSGSVGLEALSRGVARVVFIEKNPALVHLINKNLQECGFDAPFATLAMDVRHGLKQLANRQAQFDILFADPPYEKMLIDETIRLIGESSLVSGNGLIVLQHSFREPIHNANSFELFDQRRYGDTILSFLKLR